VWLKAAFLSLFICTPGIAQISSVHGAAQNLNATFLKEQQTAMKKLFIQNLLGDTTS